MLWKLVEDTVWRLRSVYLMASLMFGLAWMTSGSDAGISTALPLAGSMSCAFLLGPFLGLAVSNPRESIYLPVSRVQLWRARATVTLIVPVIVMLAAKLAGLAAASSWQSGKHLDVRTTLLSSVYDFAYISIGFGLLTASGGGLRRHAAVIARRRVDTVLWAASVLVFLAGPVWPWVFAAGLPAEWRQLSGSAWLALVAAVGIGVASFFHAPDLAHSGRAAWAGPSRYEAPVRLGTANPLIGVARLMWPEIVVSLGCFVLFALVFRFAGFQSFDRSDTFIFFAMTLFTLPVLTQPEGMGVRGALRTLRALPLSTWTLSAILSAQPVITWFFIWVLLFAGRSLLGPLVPTATAGMMCWLIGIASLANAAGLRLPGSSVVRYWTILAMAVGGIAYLGSRMLVALPTDPPVPFLALGGVPAAVWLNHQTLARKNSVYRPQKLPSMFASWGRSA